MEPTSGQRDQTFDVVIERILPGGLGLAHADGRTIMVALAAPGDRLRVRADRIKGSVAFASIVEILEPAPVRVEPPCPYFGRCGGCDFQQLTYPAQLDAKIDIIRDCLRRIAGIEDIPPFEFIPAPHEWRYRARAQWQYDGVRRRLGYFEANSHRVCDVAECAVLVPELQRELEVLREQMKQGELPDARYFRAVAGDEDVSVAADYRTASGSERVKGAILRGVDDSNNPDIPRTIAGKRRGSSPSVRKGSGSRDAIRTIQGASYHLNADSFFQTNVDLLPALIDATLDVGGEHAVELYSGVGLFTVPLARRFKSVTAVESDLAAGEFTRRSLADAGLTNAEVVNQDVADWLDGAGRGDRLERKRPACNKPNTASQSTDASEPLARQSIDFLLLDPPRTGAESRVISGILRLKPKQVCYVSCDPATLARDLKKLIAGGYAITSIRAFDMFPQTHHVETVVHLTG